MAEPSGRGHRKIDPGTRKGTRLGDKVFNVFVLGFKAIIDSTTDWIEERLINFAVGVLIKIEKSGASVLGSLIKELKTHKAIPNFLKPIFDEIENPKGEIAALLGAGAGTSAIGGLFGAIFDPLMAPVKYLLNEAIHPMFPPYFEGLAAYRRQALEKEDAIEILDAHGIQHKYRDVLVELSRTLLGLSDIRDIYLRTDLSEDKAKKWIKRQGYEDIDVDNIFNLFYKIPSISESIIAHFRGTLEEEDLKIIASKNGIPEDFLDILITANRKMLDIADVRSIFYRTDKPESWLNENLSKLGFSDDTIKDVKTILPYFPQVPDLIRFAVREVYSPDIVSKYGQMEDLPPKFLEEAKKAGLPEDQAKNFWAAHWDLPGFRQGTEMLHRGVISYKDLEELLRTLDVMPFWRDKLIQVAYTPLTRVDVRRMYNLKIIGEEQVLKAYKDIGYNDENARYMTDFTIAFYQQSEKNLTRSNIVDGYKREYYPLNEATTMLQDLGYDSLEADFYIAKADYDNEISKKKDILKLTGEQYKKGIIGDNDVISLLGAEGFQTSEVEYHLSRWTYTKKAKVTSPPKEDLKKWLVKKILTKEDFIMEMSGLGFSDKYINYYLKEMGKGSI